MDIQTRPYSTGDEKGILKLYEKVFNEEPSLDEWNWRFKEHYLGQQFIQVAEDDEKLIGQYALMPIELLTSGRIVNGALSLHTMVDSDYRGKGLFTRLASELFDSSNCNQNAEIAIGFPNQQSYPGFVKKLGWTHIGNLDLLIRPLDFVETMKKYKPSITSKPFVKSALKLAQLAFTSWYRIYEEKSDIQVRQIESFDARFDNLFERSLQDKNYDVVAKDSTYMNWRYADCPKINYHCLEATKGDNLLGIIVLSKNETRGVIVDLISADSNATRHLVAHANLCFHQKGLKYSLTWSNPDHEMHSVLRRQGFLKANSVPMIIRGLAKKADLPVDLSRWKIMPGDNDTY